MAIYCVSCDRDIPAENVNLNTGLAKCSACNAVFGIMDQVEGGTVAQAHRRDPVELPKRFQVDDFGGELKIQYRWFTPIAFALVFFCLFWDGFLVVWYVIAFTQNGPLIMKLFPIIHVTVGVALTYFVAALFVNRTEITVGDGLYRVKHGPLPWPGNRVGYSDDIEQLYVVEKINRNKNSVSIVYNVMVKQKDGTKFKLISSLNEMDQALFLEQEIERFLRIEDEKVSGEVAR